MDNNLILGEAQISQEHAREYNWWTYSVNMFDHETGYGKQHRKPVNESTH